jgi:hypothetical protein
MGQSAALESFESPVLTIERDDAIATVWLDRPEARNAMGQDLWRDLPRAMAAVSEDEGVRAVVVAAKGPHFSVGLDLKAMGGLLTGGPDPELSGRSGRSTLHCRPLRPHPDRHPALPGRHHLGGDLPQADHCRRARLLHRRRRRPDRRL